MEFDIVVYRDLIEEACEIQFVLNMLIKDFDINGTHASFELQTKLDKVEEKIKAMEELL